MTQDATRAALSARLDEWRAAGGDERDPASVAGLLETCIPDREWTAHDEDGRVWAFGYVDGAAGAGLMTGDASGWSVQPSEADDWQDGLEPLSALCALAEAGVPRRAEGEPETIVRVSGECDTPWGGLPILDIIEPPTSCPDCAALRARVAELNRWSREAAERSAAREFALSGEALRAERLHLRAERLRARVAEVEARAARLARVVRAVERLCANPGAPWAQDEVHAARAALLPGDLAAAGAETETTK